MSPRSEEGRKTRSSLTVGGKDKDAVGMVIGLMWLDKENSTLASGKLVRYSRL
jgi:hypothetical protein